MANLIEFMQLATGEISTEEYQALARETRKKEHQRIVDAVEREYGSINNYLHHRAMELCLSQK